MAWRKQYGYVRGDFNDVARKDLSILGCSVIGQTQKWSLGNCVSSSCSLGELQSSF